MTSSPPQDPRGPASPAGRGGAPWILGHRGVPAEAPENTLAGFLHAVGIGLDGFSCDVRACATGELVLLADATLDRTTDGTGALAEKTLPELSPLDAGGWFAKRFAGEPLALLEEALAVQGERAESWPRLLLEIREPAVLPLLARALERRAQRLAVRVASPHAGVCAEAQELGLAAMLVCRRASAAELALVRDGGLTACATGPGGWRDAPVPSSWRAERWSVGVDLPDELLAACRAPLAGVLTNLPRRALAVRELVRLAPDDDGRYPVRASRLEIAGGARPDGPGEWRGCWDVEAEVRNPFSFAVRVTTELVVGRGAFESQGLPAELELAPGARHAFGFRLAGGSWQPGGDPVLCAHYRRAAATGGDERLPSLDFPLERVRDLRLPATAVRLDLLRERPGDPRATVTVLRRGADLLLAIEDPGGLEQARVACVLDGVQEVGTAGLRVRLPADWNRRPGGVPFSVGLLGRLPGQSTWRWRRWAGGLPDDLRSGPPGRLFADGAP